MQAVGTEPHITYSCCTHASSSAHTSGLMEDLFWIADRRGNIPASVYSCVPWGCRWRGENILLLKHSSTQGLPSKAVMKENLLLKNLRHSPGHSLSVERKMTWSKSVHRVLGSGQRLSWSEVWKDKDWEIEDNEAWGRDKYHPTGGGTECKDLSWLRIPHQEWTPLKKH